jgi:hypothetical protein
MREQLLQLKSFYDGYHTRSYQFRKQQLEKLKAAIFQHEKDLYAVRS